jgi:hypothetical protein
MINKNKYIALLSLTSILVGSQLVGCGKSVENAEEITESTIEEISTEVETSTIEETTSESETEVTEVEASTNADNDTSNETETTTESSTTATIVKDDMVFAFDVLESDIEQIMIARDFDLILGMEDCDTDGDGIISKAEARELAKVYNDEVIDNWMESYRDTIDDAVMQSVLNQYLSEYSSDTSNSTSNSSPVGWTEEEAPFHGEIDFSTHVTDITHSTTGHSY